MQKRLATNCKTRKKKLNFKSNNKTQPETWKKKRKLYGNVIL